MLIKSHVFSKRIVHGFTTSVHDFSPHAQDWSRFSDLFGTEYNYALVSQVHGDSVLRAECGGLIGEADALSTEKKGLVLAIRTADCVPILVEAEHEVFAIHAGWRGIANGIITKTLTSVSGLRAAVVGPCISLSAYEVGLEVVDGILEAGVPRDVFVQDRSPRPHVDLKAAARYQLEQVGVKEIDVLPHCTFLDEGFHSYRRDKNRSGRLAGFIGFSF
jgi:YfiH family protein